MEWTTLGIVFWFGAILGSFFNVCIYRLPRDLSIVYPGSACPHCNAKIAWFDNIPLLSFLFLRAKCRSCHKPISMRYFFIEFAAGFIAALLYLKYGMSLAFIVASVFFSLLLVATMTDFETGLIPDAITLLGMIAGVLLSLINGQHFVQSIWYQKILFSCLGLLTGGGVLLAVGFLGKLLFKKESMGGGDVKLLAMIGAFLGAPKVLLVFLLSPFPALPFALWQKFVKKEQTIPFGPFLALTGALMFLFDEKIFDLVSRIYGFN